MTQGLPTGFDGPDDSPGLLLWRVTNRWQAAMRAALKPFGLTHVQFVLLASLSWMGAERPGEPVTQADLAAFAQTDPMMTSQVLRALESAGLVERRAHPTDRRARRLAVTPAGTDLAGRAVVAVEQADNEYFRVLGEVGPFTAALRALSGP